MSAGPLRRGQGPGQDSPRPQVPDAQVPARLAVAFARVLRGLGMAVPPDAVVSFTQALGALGLEDRQRVFWAGRATLVRRPEDRETYDRAFAAFWLQLASAPVPILLEPQTVGLDDEDGQDDEDDGPEAILDRVVRYSPREQLLDRDFAEYGPSDWQEAARLVAALRVDPATRRSRRLRPSRHRRDRLDLRRTTRLALRSQGEPLRRAWRTPRDVPRRLVLLLDVSGSMDPYARALLRFAHAAMVARPGTTEVFAVGTRLTRLTRELSRRDPDAALQAAARAVPDWSGGTRLGEGLAVFNRRYAARGLARGAVVVVLSDGWDRGNPEQLGAEMARLHRLAHRVIWANPLKASPGFAPLARGMAAALPHVDAFVEGHSLRALTQLAAALADPPRSAQRVLD